MVQILEVARIRPTRGLDGPPPESATCKKAETLSASDIGRVTVDGAIERIEHSATGTVVTLVSGNTLSLTSGETVAFPKTIRSLQ